MNSNRLITKFHVCSITFAAALIVAGTSHAGWQLNTSASSAPIYTYNPFYVGCTATYGANGLSISGNSVAKAEAPPRYNESHSYASIVQAQAIGRWNWVGVPGQNPTPVTFTASTDIDGEIEVFGAAVWSQTSSASSCGEAWFAAQTATDDWSTTSSVWAFYDDLDDFLVASNATLSNTVEQFYQDPLGFGYSKVISSDFSINVSYSYQKTSLITSINASLTTRAETHAYQASSGLNALSNSTARVAVNVNTMTLSLGF